ncbi:MAG TPA: YidC/Oxa1 family membrane protein insertase [Candidatus Saccharimonadales bacterium]|nr:YidC/Oxa1 family membrane protein insertase [Candidatus Saccharimonadales bacterium]
MQGIVYFLLFVIVFILGGKYIFPILGHAIIGLYHVIISITLNILAAIYAIMPGHDFGVTIIVFTVLIRLLMWPLLKKQMHQTKVMRKIQPELKRVKEKAKGDKQLEGKLMMELYKERGINPFGTVGVLVLQLPIILAVYQVLRLISGNPHELVAKSYNFVRHIGYMKNVSSNIHLFHETLFGRIDLSVHALGSNGKVYIPLMFIALLAAVFQYFQSKQLMPVAKDSKSLKQIFKDAGSGSSISDQSDMTTAMNGMMVKIFPLFTFFFAISVQGGLALYLLTTTLVGWAQQSYLLSRDEEEMEKSVETKTSVVARAEKAQEAEVVKTTPKKKTKKSSKSATHVKRGKTTKRKG